MKITIEIGHEHPQRAILQRVIDAIPDGCSRNAAASIVRSFYLVPHVGGHHVAIIGDENERLAVITSSEADWV